MTDAEKPPSGNDLLAWSAWIETETDCIPWHRLAIPSLIAEVRLLRREVAALRACWHQSEPWPLRDVLERLIVGANHLLIDHACDEHGYEQLNAARDAGKEILADLDALPPRPAPAGDDRAGQSPEVKPLTSLAELGQACVDWCNDTDGCHLCERNLDGSHDEDCPVWEYIEAAALDAAAQAPRGKS